MAVAYLEIIKPTESTYAEGAVAHSVLVALSPENVRGVEDDEPTSDGWPTGYWDWVGGYAVVKTSQGKHDGMPATLITLGDSDGQREIGRMVVRNDALRGERLEVVRQFEDDEQRDAWVAAQSARPEGLPDDYVEVEARTVMVGDRIFVEQDPDDDDLENGTVRVADVRFEVVFNEVGGRPIVMLVRDQDDASTFMPGEWSDHAPDEKVWVKRA